MTAIVFTYGTLKEGFANAHVNQGRRLPGEFETVTRYPLYVIGPWFLPWLVQAPGQGQHVSGQLFETDAAALARMDALERVGEPGWYTRATIDVRPLGTAGGPTRAVQVYFGASERLAQEAVHLGPIARFDTEHDARYRRP